MGKPPPKLSGLLSSGAVVASRSPHAVPDAPPPPPTKTVAPTAVVVAPAAEAPVSEATEASQELRGVGAPPAQLQKVTSPVATNGRNLSMIEVGLIDPNPLAPREVYTPQMILERADDLRNQGQHDPIHVIPNPAFPGRYIICDGWTRVQSCVEHRVLNELLAEIHFDLTLQEAAWFGYEQNEGRKQHCDLDRAMFYEKLIAKGQSPADIAKRAKLSKSLMSFYRSFGKLPEEILELARTNPDKFSATVAYQIHKVFEKCGVRRAIILASKFVEEEHPRTWLISQVQAFVNPSAHKSSAPSKQVRYSNGFLKKRNNTFEVSISVAEDKQIEFEAALEALLETVADKVTPSAGEGDA